MGVTMFKKFINKPILYLLLNIIFYFFIISFTLFFNISQDIIVNLLFSIMFIFLPLFNYFFLETNYEKFMVYTKKRKIISAIICFIIIEIFAHLVKCKILNNMIISLGLSFCALVFSYMFILFSTISKNKFAFLSSVFKKIGIFYLFAANIMAIINLYYPFT